MPKGQHGNHAKADQHPRWSADRKIITDAGYVKLRVGRSHPLADPNGYAYEHLIVWVSAGRKKPARGYILTHENDVRDDNRIENLTVTKRGDDALARIVRDPVTGRLLGETTA